MRRALTALLCALPFAVGFRPPDELRAGAPEPAPPSAASGECGLGDIAVPDFTLVDLCPGSATYEQEVTLSDHLGEVMVVYWAVAT